MGGSLLCYNLGIFVVVMSENGMLDCVLVVDLLVPSCWVGL